VSHEKRKEGTVAPLLIFTPAEAPASAAFYSGVKFPGWKNSFFFGALAGEGIVRVQFDNADPDKVLRYEKLPEIDLGRIRAIAEGPDGYLYFSTSNRDGRGDPAPTDDRIFRIRPNKE
jgi:glucose/arabinose dehydrogenase